MQYKYIISFLLFIFIAILFILLNAKAEKEWTVMIYASTDSDLHEEGSYVVELLGYIGSSNKVDFIILYDGDQRNDTRAYYVPKSSWFGSSGLKSIPLNEITNNLVNPNEANMGNPLVARDFIKYTINKYPSKKYAIVFWGHAGGGGGFAKDSGDNDKITVPEIQIILSPIKSILGRNLDVFAISSCWAGTAENFYELSNYADYAVASQTLMYRYPFDIILPTLKEMPYTTPYQLAKSFAETYISTYKAYGMDKYIASAIDLSKMNNLGKKMKLFSTALMNYDQDKIVELRSNTQRADTDNYRDLYHFAELSSNVDQLRNEANSVMNAVKEAVISDSSELPANFNGMSIYFPREAHSGYFSYHYEEYKELRFSKDTGWDKFLDTFIQGGIELQLEIPKSNSFNFPENVLSVVHNYMIKSHTYSGENPLVILIKPSIIDDLKKISINVKVNMGGDHGVYYYADWQPVESSSNTEGIFVIPAEKISGEKEVKIGLKAENTQNSIIGYSIAAYAEFEKVDENNTEQIAWSGIEARKEGKLEKINEEKYYFVLIPANTKVNVKLNYAGTNNETDFDLYVGISPPQGTGLPRIYKFDYRGFTIDANETVPMSGSIGSYDTEVKIYLLVRAYQGNGEYSLVVGRYGF